MPSSSVEEMMAELDKLSELERLVATLPSSPPPSPSRNSQGLSFSVAGIGLGSSSTAATASSSSSPKPWENRMPSDLLDTTLSLDFGVVGSAAGVSLPVSATPNADSVGEGRGRLLVHYVGGSVTFLLKIAVLAWSVRFLRRVWARHRSSTSVAVESPLFSAISCTALRKLAELDSLDFVVVDVRHADFVSANPISLKNLVNIPESELTTCLQLKDNLWSTRFSPAKKPAATDLLVFVSTRGQRAKRAAVAAAELGFNRCCVLSGGIQALVPEAEDVPCVVKYLGRDAVAFLLQEKAVSESQIRLIDVRRQEERSLYGYISGSLHIPAEDWPKALAMTPSDWERKYRFPKLDASTVVILYSRACKRAVWVAQLCADFGLKRCYVCQSGSYHWRLNSDVLPYDGFKQGEIPPKALEFSVETLSLEAAETELRSEGLLVSDQTH